MYTILLLTEETLTQHDVSRITQLHGEDEVTAHVLVPADAEHNRLIEALDDVALGNLREAFDDDNPSPEAAEQDAMHVVNASIELLSAAGMSATGSVTGSDPVPAAREAVAQQHADEIVVVTPPHPIKDGLHRDWASRLRDEVELPVLHVVSGTDRLIS